MQKSALSKIIVAALGVVCLSSCTIQDLIDAIIGYGQNASNGVSILESGDGYYKPSSTTPYYSYRDIQRNVGLDALPSTGSYNVLVLPIQLSGYPFPSTVFTDLENVLNGNGKEDTGYWESLSSFYNKSSFGKLNLHFDVGEVYSTSYTPKTLYNAFASDRVQASNTMLREAVANYKIHNGNSSTKKYDYDGDGLIDGVIMVYSCPDANSSQAIHSIDGKASLFWAYTYWDYKNASEKKNPSSPVGCTYFWLSYDFIYGPVSTPKVDAHTLIHETGHMLGLDDYYASSTGMYSDYNPTGGWVMMDENILDHDVYSKMALGWTNPYVVTGPCDLSINPSQTSGDCILIPTSSGWNGSSFDEYLLLELYTPTDLNYLDSHTAYKNRQKHYTTYGVKLYHVDARMVKTRVTDQRTWTYADESKFSNSYFYEIGATNCNKSRGYTDQRFDLIRLISADNVNTFTGNQLSDENSLFQTGSSFSMRKYSKYFPNGTTFNNEDSCPFSIEFSEVTSSYAKIKFKLS
ncbi:MAG: hypothetical protein MJ239_01090 [Bacilli bacterium]|nr:hypothetical protein [Bacilli bacterium]